MVAFQDYLQISVCFLFKMHLFAPSQGLLGRSRVNLGIAEDRYIDAEIRDNPPATRLDRKFAN